MTDSMTVAMLCMERQLIGCGDDLHEAHAACQQCLAWAWWARDWIPDCWRN